MKLLIVLAACVAAVCAIRPPPDTEVNELWSGFKSKNLKKYANDDEEKFRLKVFKENLIRVAQHNLKFARGETSFRAKMNMFSDMLSNEVEEMMTGFRFNLSGLAQQQGSDAPMLSSSSSGLSAPSSLDYRSKNLVTRVKNQGSCGSCWAFAAVGSLEGVLAKKNGKLVELSEQNLVDCSSNDKYGNNGCSGGWMTAAFQYVKDNGGVATEKSYPYEAKKTNCRYSSANTGGSIKGFKEVSRNEKSLQEALINNGPIAVAIDASNWSFQSYDGGIYDEPDCSSSDLDHAVLLVGYGSEDGKDYWIIKNSWGTDWGDNGYMKMLRNKNNHCGIASMASYPTV